MRVKCIDNDNGFLNITIGDIYEVNNIIMDDMVCYYKIDNDILCTCRYNSKRFVSSSKLRNDKINKLLNE